MNIAVLSRLGVPNHTIVTGHNNRPPFLLLPKFARKIYVKEKQRKRSKEKYDTFSRAGPAHLPLLFLAVLLPHPPEELTRSPFPPAYPSRKSTLQESLSRRRSNMARTDGATDVFLSHGLSIRFHMTRAWPAQAGHLAARWDLDWRSHHQHLSEPVFFSLSLRYDPNAPWPERNW